MQYTEAELRQMAMEYGACRTCYQPIIQRRKKQGNVTLVGSGEFEKFVASEDTCEAGHTRNSNETRKLSAEEINLYVEMMMHFVP